MQAVRQEKVERWQDKKKHEKRAVLSYVSVVLVVMSTTVHCLGIVQQEKCLGDHPRNRIVLLLR